MGDTLAFLTAILPTSGLKCLVHIQGQQTRQYFYKTIEELAAAVPRFDALGGNVYHGCASYDAKFRTKKHVQAIQAFWLDIDIAPKSSYEDAYAAAQAVQNFVGQLSLPIPLFVGSGRGLHCYWVLSRPIDREIWERYASGLKGACLALGLEAGAERTADCASILRPPGSHHRKEEDRNVECGPIPEPIALEALDPWLAYAARVPTPRRDPAPKSGLGHKLISAKAPEKIDFEKLADRCAQFGAMRATKGNLAEPIWHAAMVVLAHCDSGDAYAHYWSEGHPTYSFEETERYLARGKEKTGPTTCAHFASVNAPGCKGCPYAGKVTTPLGALVDQELRHLPPAPPGAVKPKINGEKFEAFEGFMYREADGALLSVQEKSDGKPVTFVVCAHPVYLAHVQYGEIRTASRFYHFRHYLPHHGWLDLELPAGQARGQNAAGTFADLGLNVHDGDAFRRFVAGSVDIYNRTREMQVQYEQYGWKDADSAFLYGDRVYRAEATDFVPGSAELKFRNQWLRPKPGGSVNGWKAAANKLFGAGSEGQSFAIIASFAAPLIRLINDSEGGAIVSLVTRATGTGKSTALAGAYTVYASDRRALSLTTTDTGNAKGVAMATLGNLPVIHDEFVGDPDVTKAFVKMFTEGRDKQRLDRDGQMRHSVGAWQTILFTASNASLVDTIAAAGTSDALGYRVLEFPIQSGGDFSPGVADELQKQLERNAGWAGHEFIEYIVRPDVLAWVKARLPEVMEEIYAYGGFTKEHRFWVRCLACVAVAAQIVAHLELVAFSPDRIIAWALDYFSQRERPVAKDMRHWLSVFINQHAAEMLVVPCAWTPNPKKRLGIMTPARIPNKLTIRREEDTGTYYIAHDTLRAWLIQHDVSISEFNRELEDAGISRGVKSRTLGAGTTLGGGQIKVVDIDGEHPSFSGMVREVRDDQAKYG